MTETRIYAKKRRGKRFDLFVPVQATWAGPDGQEITEAASAREISSFGAMLQMANYPAVGCEMTLRNALSGQSVRARCMTVRRSRKGDISGIGVELLSNEEEFWGVNFLLKKSSVELLEMEKALMWCDTDPRVLREFRDAVDYVRKTAWAVQEWQVQQQKSRDTTTLVPLLVSERVRRTAQLCRSLAADLTNRQVTIDTALLRELLESMEELSPRIR